jgi:hypothetical protein
MAKIIRKLLPGCGFFGKRIVHLERNPKTTSSKISILSAQNIREFQRVLPNNILLIFRRKKMMIDSMVPKLAGRLGPGQDVTVRPSKDQ